MPKLPKMLVNYLTKLQEQIARLIPIEETSAYKAGSQKLKQKGYLEGYEAGHFAGFREGFDKGKNVWIIENHTKISIPKQIDSSIYGPRKFSIPQECKQKMRESVAQAVEKKLIDPPTEDQWKMIFSDSPATCVIAGAGSGKSTTLILRVIFMLVYLGINRQDITVVSFTTASCHELRLSLIKVLAHWQPTSLSYDEAKQFIRTFHSALYRVAKAMFGNVTFFENLGRSSQQTPNQNNGLDEEIENPFSSKLNNEQLFLLNEAYKDLFNQDKTFRDHILAMLEIESGRMPDNTEDSAYKIGVLKLASNRDLRMVRLVNQRFKEKGLWPKDGLTEGPIKSFTVEGFPFYANAVVKASGQHIFIGGFSAAQALFAKEEQISDDQGKDPFPLYGALKVKQNILISYCGQSFQYINNPKGLKLLETKLQYFQAEAHQEAFAPIFEVKLTGEITSSLLTEAFFDQASFIENMGLQVSKAIERMSPFRSECLEYHFCHAITLYWHYFSQTLHKQQMMTFNEAFLLLAQKTGLPRSIPDELLRPFTHLLIDEFQDISPQIVNWLKACQRQIVVREQRDQFVSIMAIGDDWQSIYGWRGSAPDFFIKFDTHFPSHQSIGKATTIKMMENFRSIEPIIRGAEKMLEPVTNKTNKVSKATRLADKDEHGIKCTDCGKYDQECLKKIANFILEQLKYTSTVKATHKNKVIVMSRTNEMLKKLKTLVGEQKGIVFYTYHRSKGLQGEVAIMIEDCVYDQNHKLRNRIYACTGLFDETYTYDEAMNNEAYRLAYVGATRGRRRVFWFLDAAKGAAKKLTKAT